MIRSDPVKSSIIASITTSRLLSHQYPLAKAHVNEFNAMASVITASTGSAFCLNALKKTYGEFIIALNEGINRDINQRFCLSDTVNDKHKQG